jgi:uncharacterized protein
MKALKELNIESPLITVGLTKKEIRYFSKHMGLPTWNKPAFACLASRFPYDIPITEDRLLIIEKAEQLLYTFNIRNARVRYHFKLARIEVEKMDISTILRNSKVIVKHFKKLGFDYITLDLEGYRSGSLNEVIK